MWKYTLHSRGVEDGCALASGWASRKSQMRATSPLTLSSNGPAAFGRGASLPGELPLTPSCHELWGQCELGALAPPSPSRQGPEQPWRVDCTECACASLGMSHKSKGLSLTHFQLGPLVRALCGGRGGILHVSPELDPTKRQQCQGKRE